VTTA